MPEHPQPQISLIMTVRDEAANLSRLLDSVLEQTLRPADVVIVDGGSTDNTPEVARSYMSKLPLRLVVKPDANISQGRNAAIRMAIYDVVAATDAGVRLDPRWLEKLVEPLRDPGVDVVSGFFVPDAHTAFERAMGATVLPALGDIDPEAFLPSSRSVAFRKIAWARAGGYPVWLDYCEDLVFDRRLKETGHSFSFAPEAVVHFRPRSNLRDFYAQYYKYARGDGRADLWRKRHAIRYLAYSAGSALALFSWKNRRNPAPKVALLALSIAAAAYCRRPYMRLLPTMRGLPLGSKIYALCLVPIIRLAGDVAKMMGYPVGVRRRLRNRQSGS